MKWTARLLFPRRPARLCTECGKGLRRETRYCEHCGAWLAESTWFPDGSFNWGLVAETLADLLTEPTAEYLTTVESCRRILTRGKEATMIADFEHRISSLSLDELRKVYHETFDVTPSCSLDVGKQLYPSDEDRQRDFASRMRRELRSKNVEIAPYSPDNLILCLRAYARMNAAGGEDFALVVLPAVSKIAAAMRTTKNPFENLLAIIEWIFTAQ